MVTLGRAVTVTVDAVLILLHPRPEVPPSHSTTGSVGAPDALLVASISIKSAGRIIYAVGAILPEVLV